MELEVFPLVDGTVEFQSRSLAEESRQPQAILDPEQPRSEEFVRVCSWCKKVDVGGQWVEVEEAVSHLGLFDQALLPQLTHGICLDCHTQMIEIIHARGGEANQEAGLRGSRAEPVPAPNPVS
jgi:hypothetical protein